MFHPEEFRTAIETARSHGIECWPNESCGLIDASGRYVPLLNVSDKPELHFDCNTERLPFMMDGNILAMIHSHPYPQIERMVSEIPSDFGPSRHDMVQQQADDLPWGIFATDGRQTSDVMFWGDMLEPVPLEGRQFRHGPSGSDGKGDCYALIRDYYRTVLKIDLMEGPRSNNWWSNGGDLYLDNFGPAGFRVIPPEEAKVGDVFLAQIASKVPNHGGVLLEGGVILHHLGQRLSGRTSILPWRRAIVRWLRHELAP